MITLFNLCMKCTYILLFFLVLSWSTRAQTLLQQQSFEGTGTDALAANGYTATTVASGSTNIYFLRSTLPVAGYSNTVADQTSTVTNINGSYIWASESVRRISSPTTVIRGNPPADLTMNAVNVAGKTNLSVTVALADASGLPKNTIPRWEPDDFVRVQYNLDGAGWVTIGQFVGDDPGTGGAAGRLRRDANLDGISNVNVEPTSPTLTQALTDYSFAIPGSGTSLQVRVEIDDDGFSEEFGFDNIRVYGAAAASAAPVLATIESATLIYAEGQAAAQITNTITVSDADNTTLMGGTVKVSVNYNAAQDRLVFTNQNGITGSFSTSTGILTLTGMASLANYQAALRSVQYQNIDAADASALQRTIAFSVTDASAVGSNTVTRTITITTALDAASTLPYTETFETDGEGTRYRSNHFYSQNAAQFQRTNANPTATTADGTTFSNIAGSYYWVGVNAGSPGLGLNNTGFNYGFVTTKQVNAAGYANLHFQIRIGASQTINNGNQANWKTTDYFQLSYRVAGSSSWTAFGLFRGTSPNVSTFGGVLRQDSNPNGTGTPTANRYPTNSSVAKR